MKKYALILLALLFSFGLSAQEYLKAKKKGKSITYNIVKEKGYENVIIYRNEKNKLYKHKPVRPGKELNHPSADTQSPMEKFPYEDFYRVIAKSLSLEKIMEIQKDRLFVDLNLNYEGHLLEVSFLTNENSHLSVQDIEAIEKNLKKEFHVRFTNEVFKGSSYIILAEPADPSRILQAKRLEK